MATRLEQVEILSSMPRKKWEHATMVERFYPDDIDIESRNLKKN